MDLILSPKQKAFLKCGASLEVLEGTTLAGKTTVGLVKFIIKVAQSPKRLHIIAANDVGTAEKNIIQKELGILDQFGDLVDYYGNGTARYKMPHLRLETNRGEKIIFVVGFADVSKWKKALGGQYGCLLIDEINTADMDFVREAIMRSDYVMATLNPDDPNLPVYKEFINRCRPVGDWGKDTPKEIAEMLAEPPHEKWVHWFFSFDDNIGISEEKKRTAIGNVPEGTKLYKNKILGLRGKATGLVFSNFSDKNIADVSEVRERIRKGHITFKRFVLGVDTSYSQQTEDTIAMEFCGITSDGDAYVLDERVYNNKERHEPLAPSDVVREMVGFADFCRIRWGGFRYIFIDSADQATIMEARKYKRDNGSIYLFEPAWKDMKILDRINLQLGWIAKEHFYVMSNCKEYLREVGVYSWKEDKDEPEDRNDHTINACQYAWLPYIAEIGKET